MELEEFKQVLRKDDFTVGGSFWLNNWEFQVINKKGQVIFPDYDERVFEWKLTRGEFIQVIRDEHPGIEKPEQFFKKYRDDIIHNFTKAFDVLVGECGATYETIIRDVVDEVTAQ